MSEPTDDQIDRGHEIGNELTELVVDLAREESIERDADETGALFCMWINLIHMLVWSGWTEEELVNEVRTHVSMEEMPTEGSC